MKCATSTLHSQLSLQPGIFMSTPKEPYFFSNDDVYEKGIEWYASLFEDAPEGAICGESTTHYTKLPTYPLTIPRILKHIPNSRFVYVIRDPIDRLVSQYIHEWTENAITLPIDEAIDAHPQLVAYSRYAMQLQPFIDTFGFNRILLVSFDRICSRPQEELERICSFLGYTGSPKWLEGDDTRNVSSQRLRKNSLRDAVVWHPVVTWIRRTLVSRPARDWIRSRWKMKDRPVPAQYQVDRLEHIFDEDLEQLSQWIGRDIRCANFWEATLQAPLDWKPSLSSPETRLKS